MVCRSCVQPSLLRKGRPDTRERRKSSLVRPVYDVDCCRLGGFVLFWGKKETKYGWGIRKNVNTFETVVRMELLEGDKRAVCDTFRVHVGTVYFFGKTPWRTSS